MNQNFLPPDIYKEFPPSTSCNCETCLSYCKRPGWWTVEQARTAITKGLGYRMMLEISPERDFGVLSPAFKGNEGNFAFQIFSGNGCTFFRKNLCELHGLDYQPLECRFCHHDRPGEGCKCHIAIENDWKVNGLQLVKLWLGMMKK